MGQGENRQGMIEPRATKKLSWIRVKLNAISDVSQADMYMCSGKFQAERTACLGE